MIPSVGTKAPTFSLKDQDGILRSLHDYAGSWLLVYFYPKDDTPGCTKEACAIRDADPDLSALGAHVVGISADTVESHKKFVEKYNLTFPLLADTSREVCENYGVWGKKKFMGSEYEGIMRTSFLVDPDGVIQKVYENVKPEVHAAEVLADLKARV